ncbi:MAG: endonuclease MutS2 [Oscillospiraceae bacterium]|nr:endonuclease MutS2 [Oscillospiraceae bacterium]MDD4413626.1 endonuclease MutS2 [Oscillospiraceae bacterium]
MNRNHKVLELDKILEMLAAETSCDDAADLARCLVPSAELLTAQRMMADTAAGYKLMARFGSPSFGQVKNIIDPLLRARAGSSLSMRELLDVAETLRIIRSLHDWNENCAGEETCLDDRFEALSPNKYMEGKIRASILSEDEMADSASAELSDIRRKMRAASSRVREKLDKMTRSAEYQKYLQDPIVTIRSGRFVVPVKSEHRGDVAGLIHDTSSSGATVFIEPIGVVEANNELRVLMSKEKAEIERILASLSAEVGGFSEAIIEDYQIVVELNFIFAKARLAYKMKSVEPKLTDNGHIKLRRARHPLLDPETAVPIDVELGGRFDTLVITGPNTGGKTVTLKTIGLLTLMAMCGLMPPVGDGSVISVFDEVHADIGDEQSIEQSLSTFSAHMTNLIRIIDKADNKSLVLMDELGAGTDPVEGAALATAILERLRIKGARIAATTHYAELKAFAIHTPGVENGSCEFDVATLRPTYRLLIGVPGRSNAFAISERLGMDAPLVERAKQLVSNENQRLEDVVMKLEERRQSLENQLEQAEQLRRTAQTAEQKAEQRLEELEKIRENEIEGAKADARRIIERARSESEQLINELDALRREKNSADFAQRAQDAKSRLRSRLKEAEDAVDPVINKRKTEYKLPRELMVGDEVLIVDIDKKGVVISPPDGNGKVTVQAGIIKTRVGTDNLRLLNEQSGTKTANQTAAVRTLKGDSSRAVRAVRTELDIRGLMTDEGVLELDRFIDDAIMSGIEQITVIHGKGTGALRVAVHQHLRKHPSVKSFRLGVFGEGENGVTIVELK